MCVYVYVCDNKCSEGINKFIEQLCHLHFIIINFEYIISSAVMNFQRYFGIRIIHMFIMWSTLLLNSSFKSNQGFCFDFGLILACYVQLILLIGILLYVRYFEKSLISSTNYFQTGYLWMLCLITIAYKLCRRIPNFL